jgi:hypothetical protein
VNKVNCLLICIKLFEIDNKSWKDEAKEENSDEEPETTSKEIGM